MRSKTLKSVEISHKSEDLGMSDSVVIVEPRMPNIDVTPEELYSKK